MFHVSSPDPAERVFKKNDTAHGQRKHGFSICTEPSGHAIQGKQMTLLGASSLRAMK
jgi:hypothetical protein